MAKESFRNAKPRRVGIFEVGYMCRGKFEYTAGFSTRDVCHTKPKTYIRDLDALIGDQVSFVWKQITHVQDAASGVTIMDISNGLRN
jgi:hypothetical protein